MIPAKGALPDLFQGMNQTERNYAIILEAQKRSGEILGWWYERVTLKIADDCRYTPDFMVMLPSGELEFHEVKGAFVRDDARVKLRAAATQFPFRFKLAQYAGKVWTVSSIAVA